MTRRYWAYAAMALSVIGPAALGVASPQATPSPGVFWYYDGDAALEAARKTGRPILVLKVRADVGPDVKT